MSRTSAYPHALAPASSHGATTASSIPQQRTPHVRNLEPAPRGPAVRVLAADTAATMRRLQGQGFPLEWQAKQVSRPELVRVPRGEVHLVALAAAQAVDALASRVGARHADPAVDGLSNGQITRAKRDAIQAATSARVPDPELRYQLGHRWAASDDACSIKLSILDEFLRTPDRQYTDVARRLELSSPTEDVYATPVKRVARAAGVDADNPKSATNRARCRRIVDAWLEGDLDVIAAALAARIVHRRRIADDHPGLKAWGVIDPALLADGAAA